MSQLEFQGAFQHRAASFLSLCRIIAQVAVRHASGRRMAPDWDMLTEVGIRFVRHQFTHAMTRSDIQQGRARFNSLLTVTPDIYDVTTEDVTNPAGRWFTPANCKTEAVVLYCHGGGYSFRGPVSDRFAKMLAHHIEARVFMPLYRLSPEHAHPAQSEDAVAAWKALTQSRPAKQVVVIGDSAGGHMALTLLQDLKRLGLEQPTLCIGLSPWTDIGAHGNSMETNNQYDFVQGWMALKFGEWLDPDNAFGREALSPINQDFSGLAPIYLHAGGREMLRDMIVEFAHIQAALGTTIQLDVWNDMPHDFQAYDSTKTSSRQSLARIAAAFHQFTDVLQKPGTQIVEHLEGVTRVPPNG